MDDLARKHKIALRMKAEGYSAREIGNKLGISLSIVYKYLNYEKISIQRKNNYNMLYKSTNPFYGRHRDG
jgi:DNA-binding CsgD family transcriptional regulator